MSVLKKNRRTINVDNVQYVWYIALDKDSPYIILHIVSEDKSIVLDVPLGTEKQYVISKGRLFQNKKTNGTWERYLFPMKMDNKITPAFVAEIIRWATNGNEAISVNWDENLYPV
ncbi:MAG: hypothetical protein K5678_06275 [Acetatifactor sp.]|nr:hypothetical protein [Acetatifactor sp.]